MSVAVLMGLLLVSATLPACVRLFYPPLPAGAADHGAGAVVVLAGGVGQRAGRWRVSDASLRRLEHGAAEARRRTLPLLISGGDGDGNPDSPAEASMMAGHLDAARFADLWLETESHNTWANARYSAEILRQKGVSRVVLVTDREHMTRGMLCFQEQGIEVIPEPVDRLPAPDWQPSTAALSVLPSIWYEWVALVWYQLRY